LRLCGDLLLLRICIDPWLTSVLPARSASRSAALLCPRIAEP
jgi:hypothetical protein